jgi:putative (di)nucleoside polyphosphate hydrolase
MSDADDPDPDPRYRKNVGLVVFNAAGRVWLGRRHGQPGPANWQFPQGGVDAGETLEMAARRELREETGMTSVQVLARVPGWISYDFPEHVIRAGRGRGFIGQAQAWFAFRFEGADREIDIDADAHPEFDAWRWARLDEAYTKVLAEFRALIPSPLAGEGGAQP